MTSATAARGPLGRAETSSEDGRGRRRSVVTYLLVLAIIFVVWEGIKFVGGVPWR